LQARSGNRPKIEEYATARTAQFDEWFNRRRFPGYVEFDAELDFVATSCDAAAAAAAAFFGPDGFGLACVGFVVVQSLRHAATGRAISEQRTAILFFVAAGTVLQP
jgi:hypothetical protein